MARKTWAEAQRTRQRILDAAEAIFLAHGFAGSSLKQVAEAAGLTRGAIYWHFTCKKQLLHALMARTTPCEHLNSPKGEDDDPAKALIRLAMAPLERLRLATPPQHSLDLQAPAGPSLDAEVMGHAMYGEQRALLLQDLLLACDRVYRQRNPEGVPLSKGAAQGLTWLIEGLMWRWTKGPEAFDLLGIGQLAISAYVQGMYTCGGSQGLAIPIPGHFERTGSASGAAPEDSERPQPATPSR
jgi:AcrR family transcriptional regulator